MQACLFLCRINKQQIVLFCLLVVPPAIPDIPATSIDKPSLDGVLIL